MPFRPIYTKNNEWIKILIKGLNKQKTEKHSTLIPLQYQIPYNFATALKSMYFLCIFAHKFVYKTNFSTKSSSLLVFRDTFLNV